MLVVRGMVQIVVVAHIDHSKVAEIVDFHINLLSKNCRLSMFFFLIFNETVHYEFVYEKCSDTFLHNK